MPNRDELDAIAWATLDAHILPPRSEPLTGSRPGNFIEMFEQSQVYGLEHAWSDFLHHFFCWRGAECFEFAPPSGLGEHWCALLTGAAEYLSHRYRLPLPEWIEESQYFLAEPWDLAEDYVPDPEATR